MLMGCFGVNRDLPLYSFCIHLLLGDKYAQGGSEGLETVLPC